MKSILSLVGSHVEKLNPLAEGLREGARKMLVAAIETEVSQYLADRAGVVDADGRRLVVRNGYHQERSIVTGIGEIVVKKPRVHDRRTGDEREFFQSKILPPYLRRTKEIEELIPWLYLKGVSTNDFSESLYHRGRSPGFHHFSRQADGSAELVRVDKISVGSLNQQLCD